MALIFSTSTIRQIWTNQLLGRLPAGCGTTVYAGVQPTAADFQANWATTYTSASADFLWHANGITFTMQTGNVKFIITSFPPATAPSNNGTGAWAVLWNSAPSGANLASATIPNTRFVVVPISITGGDGVLRFSSLTFNTGTPVTIIDGGLSIA